jgi:hypothetical protein
MRIAYRFWFGMPHARGLWIRFYTLDGSERARAQLFRLVSCLQLRLAAAAQTRWRAAIEAGVDYIASDQYVLLSRVIKATRPSK